MFRQGIAFEVMMSPVPVLRSMLWQLIGSLLLFVILVGCLYYLVKTIVVQKRIDAIRHAFLKNMIYEMKQPSNNKIAMNPQFLSAPSLFIIPKTNCVVPTNVS